jgi:ribosomal protein L12E/L44/L45/RPP1/RPP2
MAGSRRVTVVEHLSEEELDDAINEAQKAVVMAARSSADF